MSLSTNRDLDSWKSCAAVRRGEPFSSEFDRTRPRQCELVGGIVKNDMVLLQ